MPDKVTPEEIPLNHNAFSAKIILDSDIDRSNQTDITENPHFVVSVESKCPVCLLSFPSKKEAAKHFDDIHGNVSHIQCYLCNDVIYGGIKPYLLHIAAIHPNTSPKQNTRVFSKLVSTNEINAIKLTKSLDEDMNIPSKLRKIHYEEKDKKESKTRKNPCPICDKEIKSKKLLLHIKDFHGIENYRYYWQQEKCSICSLPFRRYLLSKHLLTVHKTQIKFSEGLDDPDQSVDNSVLIEINPQKTVVSKISESSEQLLSKSEFCLKKPKNYLKEWYPEATKREKVKCQICSKKYSACYLNIHVIDSHIKRTFRCQFCSEEFDKQNLLKCHLKYVHQKFYKKKEKKHKCEKCSREFYHPSTLLNHIKNIHEKQRNHLCDICGDKFQYLHALKDHKLTHAGVKTFFCKICNKRFMKSTTCRKHIRMVHHLELTARLNNPLEKDSLPYGRIDVKNLEEITDSS